MARPRLGEMLVQAGLITAEQLRFALEAQSRTHARLGRILIDHRMVSEDSVLETLARIANIPRLDLARAPVDPAVIAALPGINADWCLDHGVVPLAIDRAHRQLAVVITDPTDISALDELTFRSSARVTPVLGSEHQVQHLVRHLFYGVALDRSVQQAASPMRPMDGMAEMMDDGEILRDMNEIRNHLQGTTPDASRVPFAEDLQVFEGEDGGDDRAAWAVQLAPLVDAQQAAARELQALFELCVARGLIKRQEYLERLARIPD